MNIRVDLSGFRMDEAIEKIRAGMEKGVEDSCELIKKAAMQNLRGDPRGAHLMSSIQTRVQAAGLTVTGAVGVGAATGIDGSGDDDGDAADNFGIWVHEGTGIYSRTGLGKPVVPWLYEGPAKEDDPKGRYKAGDIIKHLTSGMKPNPFLENAYNSEGQKVAEAIGRAITGG